MLIPPEHSQPWQPGCHGCESTGEALPQICDKAFCLRMAPRCNRFQHPLSSASKALSGFNGLSCILAALNVDSIAIYGAGKEINAPNDICTTHQELPRYALIKQLIKTGLYTPWRLKISIPVRFSLSRGAAEKQCING